MCFCVFLRLLLLFLFAPIPLIRLHSCHSWPSLHFIVGMTNSAPASPHNDPADPEVGGWGLGLIRAFATGLAYKRVDERNRLILEFDPVPAEG